MVGRTQNLQDARRIAYQFCNLKSPRIKIYGQDTVKYRPGYTKKNYTVSFVKSLDNQKVIFVSDEMNGKGNGKRITASGRYWVTSKKKSTLKDWESLGIKLW